MKSYITSIGTANPVHCIPQASAAGWMADNLRMEERERRILYSLYESSGIDKRYSVVPDYTRSYPEFEFYSRNPGLEPFPAVKERMRVYQKEALPLALEAVKDCLAQRPEIRAEDITHLIVVSCTGMYAPGLDIELVEELKLKKSTQRTAIQFMGCYAAFNAMKTASYICRAEAEAVVLVVCVELCTLHFQKDKSRDNIVSNALFGDGAAAMLVSGKAPSGISLSLESFHSAIHSDGKSDMAWHIGDQGFVMTLSSYIPRMVKSGIKTLSENLLSKTGINLPDVSYYAIHPGGRKILEACEEALNLSPEDNCDAYEVLRDYGNMSSPTVLFVLKKLWNKFDSNSNDKSLLSFAFGPGLTLESMLGRVVVN